MWAKEEYLSVLGLSIDPEAVEGIAQAETYFSSMGIATLGDIFIGTFAEQPGVTQFGVLWFVSDTHLCNAPDFRHPTQSDYVIRRRNTVERLEVKMEYVDPSLTDLHRTSRMTLQFITSTSIVAEMTAVDQNCRQLFGIARRLLSPAAP